VGTKEKGKVLLASQVYTEDIPSQRITFSSGNEGARGGSASLTRELRAGENSGGERGGVVLGVTLRENLSTERGGRKRGHIGGKVKTGRVATGV